MHTLRRHESPLERLTDAILAFAKRRCVEGVGLMLFTASVALAVSLATWSVKDPSLNHATGAPVRNLLGSWGAIASDLLIQIFGLGAVVVALVPAIWGVRMIRDGGLNRAGLRLVLWAAGAWSVAACVSALPTTKAWPLPTGLGGVAGDALLVAARTIGGGLGVFVAGIIFAAVAVAALMAACAGKHTKPEADEPEPAMARGARDSRLASRRTEEADRSDDEPSLAIIWLGGLAHAVISAKASLQRRLAARSAASAPLRPATGAAGPDRFDRFDHPERLPAPERFDRPERGDRLDRIEPSDRLDRPNRTGAPPAPIRREPVFTPPLRGPAAAIGRRSAAPEIDPSDRFAGGPAPFDGPEDEAGSDYPFEPGPRGAETNARSRVTMPGDASRGMIDDEDDVGPAGFEPDDMPEPPQAIPAGRMPPRGAPARPAPRQAPPRRSFDPALYEMPPLPLLSEPKKQVATVSKDALEQNATLLESTLEDFGVRGEIINVRPGPVVTLYELEPAPGTKSSRVISLADDIARSMSAVSARVAVVPGRNAIGIELPNQKRETVYLRELLASEDFGETKQKLALCLGKNIGGEPIIADLARMPHLLVAGTTGSGKSVAINTMILSLLYMHKPEQCRLIMVDPKMLELSVYDGIPHLLSPVVTDPKKAVIALKWAVREMEERYKKMSKLGVRNIDGFNARVAEAQERGEVITRTVQTGFDKSTGEAIYEDEMMDLEPLPYIVVIVDEMADLMMVAGKDIEGAIQRLAQMARAAGIHLIMATQRPSVDVITGTIKANFPTRISFQVTSKIDSRTILGEMGAEQLLGQGDMLYMAGGGRITRVHGPFVSDGEVEKVVAHLKAQGRPQYLDAITKDEDEIGGDDGGAVFDKGAMAALGDDSQDPYEQAVAVVLRDKKASTSYIQRRLGIGYNRAASIMERMEKEGIVGQANHAGKREILVDENGVLDED
ncbi:DNA translocase FtsK [Enterovirga rhinocerotis]|uniref:DNA translocase FtsK n=1 Tax=Enterovirga rhinocerotis TaxID=1339210 RepID=A0A4R7BWW5_9HYPH|nr:DNA translocase FtsK [Enterovirga rhinocerotis]TDR89175.1 DNA translocase FtsK [Enterovirga rhinocerotis]